MLRYQLPKLRIRAKCPKHPGYNPERSGEKFRAGCGHCESLWLLYNHLIKFRSIQGSLLAVADEINAGTD